MRTQGEAPSDRGPVLAKARLKRALVLGSRRWQDEWWARLHVACGDLGCERLGLPPDQYAALAARVTVVLHAGALVNLRASYAALRKPNVVGTREALRFAAKARAAFLFVSSTDVLPPSAEEV